VSVAQLIEELGGIATRRALLARVGRCEVDRALAGGEIVSAARGRYALPVIDEAVRRAHAMSGVLSLTSAALHHGWGVKTPPDKPHILVPTKRKVDRETRAAVHLHRGDLHPDDVRGIATSRELTLLQCLRCLPFDEALAVADSALRHGEPPATLRRIAATVRGPGAPQVRRVTAEADGDAANPFESVLRAIALDVPGLNVRPQRVVETKRSTARPDLVDVDLGVVLEADSFEWHGDRVALRRDARRYNLLVVDGWIVLRFAWEDVMFDQDYVREVLVAAVEFVQRRTEVPGCRCGAA
jgi:very-short-patch-repair endonuclease